MEVKELLGAGLYAQVMEALKGKGEGGKDVELVVGNDGSVIPKAKFDELNDKYKAAEQLAKDMKKQMDDLKAAGDPASLAQQLADAQAAVKQQADEHKAAMEALELDYAVRTALTDAHDASIVAGLLDRTKLRLRDGSVEGLRRAAEGPGGRASLSCSKRPGQPAKPAFTGKVPASPTAKPGGDINEMSMEEYRAYRNQAGGFPRN